MIDRIWNWLRGRKPEPEPVYADPLDDPALLETVIRECSKGNVVIGNRRPDGSWKVDSQPIGQAAEKGT